MTVILRTRALRRPTYPLQPEVGVFVESYKAFVDEAGHRRVVRNGYLPERSIQTGIDLVRAPAACARPWRRQPPVHIEHPAALFETDPEPGAACALAVPEGDLDRYFSEALS